MPLVGFLCLGSREDWSRLVTAFRQGLSELGFVEGKNVRIEFRWADGRSERLPTLANDLAHHSVAVLVATGGPSSTLAAKAATSTIPIVFTLGADPVKLGVVRALGRPGGNITGVTFITAQLNEKRVELLHELAPKASVVAVLVNPDNPNAEVVAQQTQEAARLFGQKVHLLRARTEGDIDAAFATLASLQAGALFVGSDGFFFDRRGRFGSLAAHHAVPTSFESREFVIAGGLMSYGASILEAYRQAGIHTGRILIGANPADLPVLQPTKVELVINLKTAKKLALTIPQSLLLRTDEVIQ